MEWHAAEMAFVLARAACHSINDSIHEVQWTDIILMQAVHVQVPSSPTTIIITSLHCPWSSSDGWYLAEGQRFGDQRRPVHGVTATSFC